MDYKIKDDIELVKELLNISDNELVENLHIDNNSLFLNDTISLNHCNIFYDYAYKKGLHINAIKSMFYIESYPNSKILFHGSKKGIVDKISLSFGIKNNDFGIGFYCGETYQQPISLVSHYDNSSLYILEFKTEGLKQLKFDVDTSWMLSIAYFRGTLDKYTDHPIIKKIIKKVNNADYIIAPIADNRMFKIIDTFINGEITDEQCKHCLAATNLGYQYVLVSNKAIEQVKILEHCFICDLEKNDYLRKKEEDLLVSDEKVKSARIKYRGVGQYIDELLL